LPYEVDHGLLTQHHAKCIYNVYMNANILDLRYRMRKVLRALESREQVTVYHRGKMKGILVPAGGTRLAKADKHPLFGIRTRDRRPVKKVMDALRGGRYRAL